VAESRLARSRLPLDPWRDRLSEALLAMLETDLGEGVRLRDVPRDARLAEMEFLLPVTKSESGKRFTARALADVLAESGGHAASYAERARRLGFPPLEGFLHGFIDLAFQQNGRFYLVDWKSSFLGPSPDDYAPSRLVAAMEQHHYVLQYHLYAVALHRWLGQRVPGYDYDAHFGGVRYVFVRGVTPATGETRGVFVDRPSRGTIEGLSRLLSDGA
jgi:exodeoxyribonuclease V beta subunit